jgi:hypothetical protein
LKSPWTVEQAILSGEILRNDSLISPGEPPMDVAAKTGLAFRTLGDSTRTISRSMKDRLAYRRAVKKMPFAPQAARTRIAEMLSGPPASLAA